jgi:hypothetical protein
LLAEVLTLAYGKEIAGFVIMLGPVMKSVADYCNIIRLMEHSAPSGHWTTDPHIFDQVAQQVTTLLEAIRPSGPTISQPPVTAAAEQMIREVRGDAGHSGFGETAKTVQRLLGPLAERLKDNKQYWDEPPQQSLAGLSSTAIDAIRLENLARQVVEVGKTLALALTARSHEARPKNRPQIEPRRKRSTKREKRRGAD